MKRGIILSAIAVMAMACSDTKKVRPEMKEDLIAKQMLQGVWIDENTEMPLFRIDGDTIYYADPMNAPATFKVVHDTIYIKSSLTESAYKIDRQTDYSFWFYAIPEERVKLYKSEDASDVLLFKEKAVEVISTTPEVVKKDSIILYDNRRFRGYVYINPSQIKVLKTSYTEGGMAVENVYYDNIIHICVYEGAQLLYGQDIHRKMFAELLPESSLSQMILADMLFTGVDEEGFHFQATLGIPESQVYHVVNLTVGSDQQLHLALKE